MQKPGQNLLAKTSRSAYSYLNNGTVVANFRESELFTFEGQGSSFHVTPLQVPSHSGYSMILEPLFSTFPSTLTMKKKSKKPPNKPNQNNFL